MARFQKLKKEVKVVAFLMIYYKNTDCGSSYKKVEDIHLNTLAAYISSPKYPTTNVFFSMNVKIFKISINMQSPLIRMTIQNAQNTRFTCLF